MNSLWMRFKRAIIALFGGAVKTLEDPKLMLEQNIRDMNDQVPKMNENIATIKANHMMLEKSVNRHEREHQELSSKVMGAINQGRDDVAATFAIRLESVKVQLENSKQDLEVAKKAYDKALEVKAAFMREKDRKVQKSKEALQAYNRSQWQSKIADSMESFEVGGSNQSYDEMLTKINEKTAQNEAKMDMALESVDTTFVKTEEEAEKLRAMDLVNHYKTQMVTNSENQSENNSNITKTKKLF